MCKKLFVFIIKIITSIYVFKFWSNHIPTVLNLRGHVGMMDTVLQQSSLYTTIRVNMLNRIITPIRIVKYFKPTNNDVKNVLFLITNFVEILI